MSAATEPDPAVNIPFELPSVGELPLLLLLLLLLMMLVAAVTCRQ